MLLQQSEGAGTLTPQEHLAKALYVLNFLNFSSTGPPISRHYLSLQTDWQSIEGKAWVLIRNLESGIMEGPFPLITWGRGYACVSTGSGPRWIPAHCVWLYRDQPSTENSASEEPNPTEGK